MPEEDNDLFGPIDVIVVEFPSGVPSAAGFARLLDLVDNGTIRVLDLEFVRRSGSAVSRVDGDSLSLPEIAAFAGASSGLLDETDLSILADELTDGALAAVVLYEELGILGVLNAWSNDGAKLVLEGHLTPVELAEALDATDVA